MIASCFILSAGLGTRMRPLTSDIPKPMVPILGKPIIGYIIDMLLEANITNIVVNYHYKPNSMIAYLQEAYASYVSLSNEIDLLMGSGGGIVKAMPWIQSDTFFVINADCIWDYSTISPLLSMQDSFQPDTMDVMKLVCPSKRAIGFDSSNIYSLDAEEQIIKGNDFSFTGIQIVKKSLFEAYALEPFSIREVWNTAFENKKIYGHIFEGQWLHIGTPEAVPLAENYLTGKNEAL